jgi:pimeloyl-ACP methyl ester carboxylesterase
MTLPDAPRSVGRSWTVRHNRISLAVHELRGPTTARARPLLLLHGLGERSPDRVPTWCDAWPGPVVALDFTGHGDSTVPAGGGYTAEMLLGDADAALGMLNDGGDDTVTVLGRGLGAYVALQLAGARASLVHGAILVDGPGLAGGPTGPTSQSFFSLPPSDRAPDPYALVELGRDLRPPDYATSFVRLAVAGSPLDQPVAVCSVFRPPWLDAVAREHGVMDVPLAEALAAFAG